LAQSDTALVKSTPAFPELDLILTVTPNPSLDLLFEAGRLVWDDANRIDAPRARPGGQGVNVTRAARALGGTSLAVALLGGRVGDELERFRAAENTPHERIRFSGETRVFIGARETETGRSLLLNPRGPRIAPEECDRIIEEAVRAIASTKPAWVAACGSIPPGLPVDFHARIGAAAREAGARFVPDCDGEALRAAAPYANLLVPNQHEAERLLKTRITDVESSARCARMLLELGAEFGAITLGERGAVLTNGRCTLHATAPQLDRGSAVGAGDSFLAALLVGLLRKEPLDDLARQAVAAGSAVLAASGSELLSRAGVEALSEKVEVRQID
jgi:6-phosphofructokinase 2